MLTKKILSLILLIQLFAAFQLKAQDTVLLAGTWKITSALGNDGRHWVGTLELKQVNDNYTGTFKWKTLDGKAKGIDHAAGKYDAKKQVLTLHSLNVNGNIEVCVYTVDVLGDGTVINGTWTGSGEGTVEDPGRWSATKQ